VGVWYPLRYIVRTTWAITTTGCFPSMEKELESQLHQDKVL
jgi:hypothetical protein